MGDLIAGGNPYVEQVVAHIWRNSRPLVMYKSEERSSLLAPNTSPGVTPGLPL